MDKNYHKHSTLQLVIKAKKWYNFTSNKLNMDKETLKPQEAQTTPEKEKTADKLANLEDELLGNLTQDPNAVDTINQKQA